MHQLDLILRSCEHPGLASIAGWRTRPPARPEATGQAPAQSPMAASHKRAVRIAQAASKEFAGPLVAVGTSPAGRAW